jgi:hypothetical protein
MLPTVETTSVSKSRALFTAGTLSVERSERGEAVLGGQIFNDFWQSQKGWVRRLMAPPLTPAKDADVAAVTRIRVEEISLTRLSRTPGRKVIPLTDAQAKEIKRLALGE